MEARGAVGEDEVDLREGKATFTDSDKAELRDYFKKMRCNIRVLGSQLGLELYDLDDIQDTSTSIKLSDRRLMLLDECLKKEKLQSWEQLVITLDKPALKLTGMAMEIRKKHIYSKQCSLDSHSSMNSPTSPEQSLGSSFSSSRMEVSHGEEQWC